MAQIYLHLKPATILSHIGLVGGWWKHLGGELFSLVGWKANVCNVIFDVLMLWTWEEKMRNICVFVDILNILKFRVFPVPTDDVFHILLHSLVEPGNCQNDLRVLFMMEKYRGFTRYLVMCSGDCLGMVNRSFPPWIPVFFKENLVIWTSKSSAFVEVVVDRFDIKVQPYLSTSTNDKAFKFWEPEFGVTSSYQNNPNKNSHKIPPERSLRIPFFKSAKDFLRKPPLFRWSRCVGMWTQPFEVGTRAIALEKLSWWV